MKAIVTGHTGAIGLAVFNSLIRYGADAWGWSRSTGYDVTALPPTHDVSANLAVHCAESGPDGLAGLWSAIKDILAKSDGAFVYLSSIESLNPSTSPYARSKFAQEIVLNEMASYSPSVRVNCLRLGHVIGTKHHSEGSPLRPEQFLGRYVTLQEVSDTVLWLANCKSITGQIVTLDSGITLKR